MPFFRGRRGFDGVGGFAANGYGDLSPGGYGLGSAFTMELLMTFFFLFIIIGATSPKAPAGFAPIAIGLGLTLIHLVSIPVTNTSVNPARSTSQALFAGGRLHRPALALLACPRGGGSPGRTGGPLAPGTGAG